VHLIAGFSNACITGHLARCLIDCNAPPEEIIAAYMHAIRLKPTDIRPIDECSRYALSMCKARACSPAILKQAADLLGDLCKNPGIYTELKTPRSDSTQPEELSSVPWETVESRIRQLKDLVSSRMGA
jgi:hypothetical protein